MDTERPIFIIGCPRSGTTLTLRIMAIHKDLAWISNYLNYRPQKYKLAYLSRVYNTPKVGKNLYKKATERNANRVSKLFGTPSEPWKFWEYHLEKFRWERNGSIKPRRRNESDINQHEIEKTQKAVERIKRYQGKKRFISKYTDFPRMKYLLQVFPNAKFVHIKRSGYAVAASYKKKMDNNNFGTWNERKWWISGWPEEWQQEWKSRFNSRHTFVAYQWNFFVNQIIAEANEIKQRNYFEIQYSNIISDPADTFEKVFNFCGLDVSDEVKWYLDKIDLQNMNKKWKSYFTDEEIKDLEYIIGK